VSERPTLEELIQMIFTVLREELLEVGDDFTPKTDLVEAGLDSLGLTQLLLTIEERTGTWVDESDLTPENLESTEALARCVLAAID
jgi:acyl carrier protein